MNSLSKKLLKAVKKNGIVKCYSSSKNINGERKNGQMFYVNMDKVNNKNNELNNIHSLAICVYDDLSTFVQHEISLNKNNQGYTGYCKLHTIDDPEFLVKFNKYLEKHNQGALPSSQYNIDKILDDLIAD